MTRRLLAHLLVAIALLLAQQGALSHAVSHAYLERAGQQPGGDANGKGKLAHSLFCAHWLSYAGMHGAANAHGFALESVALHLDRPPQCEGFSPAAPIRAFESRAPPVSF